MAAPPPKKEKRQQALRAAQETLQPTGRLKFAHFSGLRGLLAWLCHVYEPWRPFLAAPFARGSGASHRTRHLAWGACPAEVRADLQIWQALLRRDLFVSYFQPVNLELIGLAVADACAGTGQGEGCCWASGCGVGGVGPNGEWLSEEDTETICGWAAQRHAGSQLSGPMEPLAVIVAMRLWGGVNPDAAHGVMGFPVASDNLSNVFIIPKCTRRGLP